MADTLFCGIARQFRAFGCIFVRYSGILFRWVCLRLLYLIEYGTWLLATSRVQLPGYVA